MTIIERKEKIIIDGHVKIRYYCSLFLTFMIEYQVVYACT